MLAMPSRQIDPLYNHQSEAIREVAAAKKGDQPALVITAGTGLGKTEAFLLPMLSDLWDCAEKAEGRRNEVPDPLSYECPSGGSS